MNNARQKNLFSADHTEEGPYPWELAEASDQLTASIVFNRPLETVYMYLVPEALRDILQPGQRVRAPFGRGDRPTIGFCVDLGPPPKSSRLLKSLESVIDNEPLLSPKMLELTRWIADRYLCGWGQVLESVVPAGVKKKAGTRVVRFFQLTENFDAATKLPPKQQAVVEVLRSAEEPLEAEELTNKAGCGISPINTLRKKGIIQAVRQRTTSWTVEFDLIEKVDDLQLNNDQQQSLSFICDALRAKRHETLLLHGVTGSGKTEVYIQAIREVVSYGKQAIVLVPEISLTPQTIRQFRSRFDNVAVLHSHLSDAERHWQWQQIARGSVQVVVGARSAIFAPLANLGLIVIDEEHETTFKQETVPRYHAREVARRRAEMENIPLILGSATPTLEAWQDAHENRSRLITMDKRIENRPMPPVVIVDVRNDPHSQKGEGIGRALGNAMRMALSDNGQIILFLNVRGFAPALWCRACGESLRCPDCDITLTWHKDRQFALCHSCDYNTVPSNRCPSCGHSGMRMIGMGTQRLEAEVKAKFPGVKCLRMDSDSMSKPGSHDAALERFRHGEVPVLLGTQMIAKGLDFPNVTLVGVVDADTILHQPDLRATERTFQLISQVAGRTGRSSRGGRVLVQTCCPTEPAILKAAEHDYVGFVQPELAHRKEFQSPPFRKLARIILRGPNERDLQQQSQIFADTLQKKINEMESPACLLGPAPAPITRLKANYRYHIQLSATELEPLQQLWRAAVPELQKKVNVEFIVDVDPVSMR